MLHVTAKTLVFGGTLVILCKVLVLVVAAAVFHVRVGSLALSAKMDIIKWVIVYEFVIWKGL